MSIRTINYTITANGITPAAQQFGGVQGEHNATELVFTLDAALLETIREKTGENEVVYRFDVHDGAGGVTPTDPLPLTDEAPTYLLENKISRIGGNIQVFLIITEIKNEHTKMDLFSFPALLRLKNKQDGPLNEGENYESLSTLSETAKQSAADAVESAQASEDSATAARHAQLQTEAARLALEGGAEVVFLGGNHAANIEIIAAVDNEMSEASHNPVQNKIVFEKINANMSVTNARFSRNEKNIATIQENTEEKALFMAMHPIGSLYWSGENVNPANTFGGKWELVDKEFASFEGNSTTDYFTPADNTVENTGTYIVRGGHGIRIRQGIKSSVELNDTEKILGTFNFKNLGVERFPFAYNNIPAFHDAAENGVICIIAYDTGVLRQVDTTTAANTFPSGNAFYIDVTVVIKFNNMLDSACDKFCWKRVA